jgi:quinol monooxygenase YgiN
MITTKPGMRSQVLDLFKANVPAVLAEKGCIEYSAAIDTEGMGGFQAQLGDDSFAVIEKWES